MCSDAPPDHVNLLRLARFAVLEGRSAVARPGHLEDTGSSLDPLDAQATAERAGSQILDELRNGRDELRSLLGRKLVQVLGEASGCLIRRHLLERSEEVFVGLVVGR